MAKRRADLEEGNIESLWVEITPTKGKSFLIGTVYRNPAERADWIDRDETLIDIVLLDKKEMLTLGHFNKNLLYTNHNKDWLDTMTSLGLTQLVNSPTRVTSTTSTLIDHIYTSNEENTLDTHVSQIGLSNHYAIFCCRKINFPHFSLKSSSNKSIKYRSFKSFDENAFFQDLSVFPWSEIDLL